MNKPTERKFEAADAHIERAVNAFTSKIEQILDRYCQQAVARSYIIEATLLALCDGMTKLIDDPSVAAVAGPAALKLSNALADYRDSLPTER